MKNLCHSSLHLQAKGKGGRGGRDRDRGGRRDGDRNRDRGGRRGDRNDRNRRDDKFKRDNRRQDNKTTPTHIK